MSLVLNLGRTLQSALLIGLASPVRLKNNSGAMEVKNGADSAFATLRAGTPSGDDDVVTKSYGDANYSMTGSRRAIAITLDTTASKSSTATLPDGSVVLSASADITTAYDNSATLQVGVSGTTDKFGAAADFDLATTGLYEVAQQAGQSGAAAVLATISGSPTTGAGMLVVEYAVADT